ncbi:hypothetical protein CHS0354_022601 [Potamilus streckersoni]|uniref:Toll-like receptor 4 n=1 Tax=Potamilus streckersoni TaxID=2493646 RepID=A0AAE0RY58_9BIVA|nr:hypothetical protein CHS0354_022601 [Potamilus streckersoni]
MDSILKAISLVVFMLGVSFLPHALTTFDACPFSCKCSSENVQYEVVCPTFIPQSLPSNTHFVQVENIRNKSTINQQDFNSASWASVKELSLSSNTDIEEIEANAFSNLTGLSHLHIHFTYLKNLSPSAFSDLQNLSLLNMSENGGISFTQLKEALSIPNSLQNLQELILVGLNRDNYGESVDSTFFEPLAEKPLRFLDLTRAFFTVLDVESFSNALGDTIQVINMSHSFSVGKVIMPSNHNLFPNLEIFDISFTTIPWMKTSVGVNLALSYFDCYFPFVLANQLKLNAILDSKEFQVRLNGETRISANCERQIRKRLELSNNNFVWLNASFSPNFPTYQEVDISNNGVMYLGANITGHLSELVWVNLSGNKLSHMEQYPEFETLFQKNILLEWMDLSSNGLTNIPRNVFQNNNKLKTLILANNKLNGIFFEIKHLQHLEVLDVSKNLIAFFDNSALSSFEILSSSEVGETSTFFSVQFTENELLCSCETVDFVRWFVTTNVMIKNRDVYTCYLNKEVVLIDTNTLKESKYQCEKTKIIIISVCTSLACIGLLGLTIGLGRYIYRRRRKIERIRRLVNKYRVANPPNKYLLFLSFCSKDDDFVSQYVIDELRHRLQERLPNGENLVCIGDQEFELGKFIIEEIIKCIEASSVMIFVVSKAFCESNYCEYETIVAQLDRKPTVLMFREEVEPKKLPKVLHKHFNQFVRARWIQDDGVYSLKPDWDKVCDSILELAGKSLESESTHKIEQTERDCERSFA